MFQEYYGFTRTPFSTNIPPHELFAANDQKELAARLNFLVRQSGIGLLTGEIGSGKSTAVRSFAASLDANRYLVIYLANPLVGMTGLYRDLLLSMGHEPPFGRAKLVTAIRSAFDDLLRSKHRSPIVILDEAHLLPHTAFEQFRLLFSSNMDSQSLGSLLLIGHPDLRRILKLSIHEAFRQRLSIHYHLSPLDLQETIAYIRHHLTIAGCRADPLFTDDAFTRIFNYTKGVPRLINRVCTTALMAGLIDRKTVLEESIIRKAIADLEQN